eukprot:495838_1
MGCVSSLPHETNNINTPTSRRMTYEPHKKHWIQLEYPRTKNESITNSYSIHDQIEVLERVSNQWVNATIIKTHNNWIRVLSLSPTLQFTDKFHIISDKARLRTKRKQLPQLASHGMELISYDEDDDDTIYKAFAYVMCVDSVSELKQQVSCHMNDDKVLSERDHMMILSHVTNMNVIVYQSTGRDLSIQFEHKYHTNHDNTRCVRLLCTNENKYQLMSLSMDTIIGYIDGDQTSWNTQQILQWFDWIEFGRFSDAKYEALKQNISDLKVNGSDLFKMNDLTLRSMGIDNETDRKRIILNINQLITLMPQETTTQTAGATIQETIQIPDSFLDPIHYLIMRDPVLSTVSGHSFERQSITQWVNQNHSDPINQKELHLNLHPLHLRMIQPMQRPHRHLNHRLLRLAHRQPMRHLIHQ